MPHSVLEPLAPTERLRPLCVDLDGTLVKSDTLHELLIAAVRLNPRAVLAVPTKLLRGKAAFKAHMAAQVDLDVAHLPYNRDLLEFLQSEHANGREIYLATGTDIRLARRIADHLAIFKDVLASNGTANLIGAKKLEALKKHFAHPDFDYIGNDVPDVALLAHAHQPMIANPTAGLRARLRKQGVQPAREFHDRRHLLNAVLKILRLHQWAKNLLMFLPLLLAHTFRADKMLATILAFAVFSLAASATYIFNDLLDIHADRRHHRKRHRPFASGDLSPLLGVAIAAALLLIALTASRLLPGSFYAWLLFYLAATVLYSSYLKRIALIDVLVLSGLYTLRLMAGAAATSTPISPWMFGFSIFLFLSLAIVKRFAELENLRSKGAQPRNGRGYKLSDFDQLRSLGTSSAFAAIVVFAIYINGVAATALYHRPARLWLAIPLMMFWLTRTWLLASRGELNEDPIVFAITDRTSILTGLGMAAVALLAL